MIRRIGVVLCAALLALGGTAPAQTQPYEINVLLGLTGGGAFVGQANQIALQALELIVNKQGGINGRPIHFAIYDNKTDPQVAVQLANELIAKKASTLFVSGFVAACRAVAALVNNGPVEYCLSPALYPERGGYVFSAGTSTYDTISAMLRFFRERGWRKIGTITSTDASGQDADAQLDLGLGRPENKALQLVDREHFSPKDVSVAAQLAKLKEANPDVVVAWTSGTPFGTVLRAIKEADLEVPIATTNGNMVYHQIKQYAGLLPKDLYFPGPGYIAGQAASAKERALQQQFVDAIKQKGGIPDYETGEGWDPALLVIDALRHLGTNATPDQIRRYILSSRGMPGISGIYDFSTGNQRGLSEKDVVVMRWDDAKDWWTAVSLPGGMPLK